jgi:hypothetical protein
MAVDDPRARWLTCGACVATLWLVGCDDAGRATDGPAPSAAALDAPVTPGPTPTATADAPLPPARNMRLLARHDLQARSAYMPVVHRYADRWVLFVGHHSGEAMNPLTGRVERNGLSILDVTDPRRPELLSHWPPTGDDASGTQHVQVCAGAALPDADPGKVYAVRTNGNVGHEVVDVTDPATPVFVTTIAETGTSSRPESERGDRETHKFHWDCETGIAYLNGTAEGWRVTRVLQAFDLGNPEAPRHIRDFGLTGWQPGASGPYPAPQISGLHQPVAFEDRIFLGYGSGNDGVLQILDRDAFVGGNADADDPFAPLPANLIHPQIARLDLPSFWGVHTAKPIYGLEIADYADNSEHRVRDIVVIASESGAFRCQEARDVVFFVDITDAARPLPIATFQVPEEPGDFCHRGGRFGPHSMHDARHPGFDRTLLLLAYFNAGVRAVDIRNPFDPVEVGHFIPETTANTTESCIEIDGREHCDVAIQTNNVNIDDRGLIYAVDRASTGLDIIELTGEAAALVR